MGLYVIAPCSSPSVSRSDHRRRGVTVLTGCGGARVDTRRESRTRRQPRRTTTCRSVTPTPPGYQPDRAPARARRPRATGSPISSPPDADGQGLSPHPRELRLRRSHHDVGAEDGRVRHGQPRPGRHQLRAADAGCSSGILPARARRPHRARHRLHRRQRHHRVRPGRQPDDLRASGAALTVAKANLTALMTGLRAAAGSSTPIVGITYPDVLLADYLSPDTATKSLATLSVLAFKSLINSSPCQGICMRLGREVRRRRPRRSVATAPDRAMTNARRLRLDPSSGGEDLSADLHVSVPGHPPADAPATPRSLTSFWTLCPHSETEPSRTRRELIPAPENSWLELSFPSTAGTTIR